MRWSGVRCTRCCLHKSLRVVNLLVNFVGLAMIVYSLWLLKKWLNGLAQLPSIVVPDLPKPWFLLACLLHSRAESELRFPKGGIIKLLNFIRVWVMYQSMRLKMLSFVCVWNRFVYTCLGVGILVSLSTIGGHIVANYISSSVLCIYIVSISSLILLQAGVVFGVLFKMDLADKINEYIDATHAQFKAFIIFHMCMCKLITIMMLAAQTSVVAVACVLFVVRLITVSSHCNLIGAPNSVPDFKYSFLIPRHPSAIEDVGSLTL